MYASEVRRILVSILIATLITSGTPTYALHNLQKQANSISLADPGLLVLDPVSGKSLVESGADTERVPASVLKLFTTTVVLSNFDPNTRYVTSIWSTNNEREFQISTVTVT